MALHNGNVAEEIAAEDKTACPCNRPADTVSEESQVIHPAYPRDKRNECAEYRHKSGDYDGLPAVLFVKPMGFVEMLFAEDSHIFLVENLRAYQIPNPVISIVAANYRQEQKRPHKAYLENAVLHRRKRAGREKQRIARQKWRYDKSRLAEKDNKKNQINPCVILRDDRLEGLIKVKKQFY